MRLDFSATSNKHDAISTQLNFCEEIQREGPDVVGMAVTCQISLDLSPSKSNEAEGREAFRVV